MLVKVKSRTVTSTFSGNERFDNTKPSLTFDQFRMVMWLNLPLNCRALDENILLFLKSAKQMYQLVIRDRTRYTDVFNLYIFVQIHKMIRF